MPTVARSRVIGARAGAIWELIADPHNMPRWWPETGRVEDVEGEPGTDGARFTQVMSTSGGRPVRADYRCAEPSPRSRILWRQEIEKVEDVKVQGSDIWIFTPKAVEVWRVGPKAQ